MHSLVSKALKNENIEGRIHSRNSLIVIIHMITALLIFCFISSFIVEYSSAGSGHKDFLIDARWYFFIGILFQVFIIYLLKNNIKKLKAKIISFS